MKAETRKFILALAIFSVTGIGVFALPYAFSQSGSISFVYFALLAPAVLIIEYLFAKVTLKIKTRVHSIPGYANLYLGRRFKTLAFLNAILGFEGIILSYIAASGLFLNLIFPLSSFYLSLLFALVGFILIFFDIRSVARSELFISVSLVTLFLILSFSGLARFNQNYFQENLANPNARFLAYGVILFALAGFAAVPIIREEIGENENHLKKVLIIGNTIIWTIYLLYVFSTLGLQVSPAKASIPVYGQIFGKTIGVLGGILGTLSIFASFLVAGLYLKNVFHFDYGLSKNFSFVLTSLPVIILFLLGLHNFVTIISFLGGLAVATDATLILSIWRMAEKPSGLKNALATVLGLILLIGATYEIYFTFLK